MNYIQLIRKRVTLLILAFITCQVHAQQAPVYSQYMMNKFLVNPAVAGATGYTFINAAAREQFAGLVNAPRTFSLTAQSRMLEDSYIRRHLAVRKNPNKAARDTRIGLGGHLYSDRNGIITKTGIQLSYAYHINFNNKFQLSMGLTGSGFQYKLDDSDTYLADMDDPLLDGKRKTFWVPDICMGTFITDNKFYAGISMSDVFGSSLKLGKDILKENYRTLRHYNIMAGYRFRLENGLSFEPFTLLTSTAQATRLDLGTKAYFKDDYWFGLSYRSDNTMVTMLGMQIDMFYFGYAYDASFNAIRNYSSGSHEIMMGVRLGDNSSRRFRWLKKDQIEYDM